MASINERSEDETASSDALRDDAEDGEGSSSLLAPFFRKVALQHVLCGGDRDRSFRSEL